MISNAKISDVRLKGMRLSGQRLIGMRPSGMRPNGMRLKGYGSRERVLKECGPTGDITAQWINMVNFLDIATVTSIICACVHQSVTFTHNRLNVSDSSLLFTRYQ